MNDQDEYNNRVGPSLKEIFGDKPCKPWRPGDRRVEPYMSSVSRAIKKHVASGEAFTDIYNRCYEAVFEALKDYADGSINHNYGIPKLKDAERKIIVDFLSLSTSKRQHVMETIARLSK